MDTLLDQKPLAMNEAPCRSDPCWSQPGLCSLQSARSEFRKLQLQKKRGGDWPAGANQRARGAGLGFLPELGG